MGVCSLSFSLLFSFCISASETEKLFTKNKVKLVVFSDNADLVKLNKNITWDIALQIQIFIATLNLYDYI